MKVNLLIPLKVAAGKVLQPGVHDVDATLLKGLPEGIFEVVEVEAEKKQPKK